MNHRQLLWLFLAAALSACGSGGALTCSLEGGSPLASSAWPKFRHDAQNTGLAPVTAAATEAPASDSFESCAAGAGRCRWRQLTGGAVASSPSIGKGGDVYVGSSDGKLYAFTGDQGANEWKLCDGGTNLRGVCTTDADCPGDPAGHCTPGFPTDASITSSPAIDASQQIFITSGDGGLYTLNAADGSGARTRSLLIGFLAASVSIGSDPSNLGVVYVGSVTGGLYALCPNLVLRWSSLMAQVRASPALGSDGTVYYAGTTDTRQLFAVMPVTGQTQWAFTARGPMNASPAIDAAGRIYIADTTGAVFAVNAAGAATAEFAAESGAPFEASPAIGADGTIYLPGTDGIVRAFNSDLQVLRTFSVPGGSAVRSSPAVTEDGTIVFGADDGVVYALRDPGSGEALELLWTFATGGSVRSSPAVSGDGAVIYVGSDDGYLYSLRF